MITTIKNDIFLKHYAIFFSGSMMVALLNYAFHPILARLMDPASFGDIQALISLIAVFGALLGAFSVVAVNITANLKNTHELNAVIAELQRLSLVLVGIGIVALLAGAFELKKFLNFSSIYPLIGLGIILPVSAINTFRNAYLQGSGRFTELSTGGIISSATKLILATALVYIGLGSIGATIGIIMAGVASYYYLVWRTRGYLDLNQHANIHALEKGRVRKEVIYGVLVLFATSLVTLFFTIDILVVKHFFSAYEAGLYSGISAIAKILYFAIGPVAGVLLSSIKIRNTRKENSRTLIKALALSLSVGGIGILTFYIFNDLIISIMIGQKYLPFAYLLPKAGLVMLLAAITNVLVFYFLALRRFFLIVVSCGGIILTGLLLTIDKEGSIESILNNILISLTVVISVLLYTYAKDHFNSHSGI
ncbi:hypothetical protein A2333_01995 [Candidatus Wolfebacteria bacterium RIFOXYB2_FULL_49_7]|uniref:Polysaccharide biosynthesis protein C-terminal domain-containing protein n=1 Tax=Candidatus Wolfebacteria bacterium RIFOXYB1_FULL_54_12 TaxID=1802559 RepID=A0A1F8DYU3_9BACT|nr:MAG: hypothetical protein A2372_03705 [Candidatus Wolfebacteria bacterium RIFOXYB1_FULL_54_12]OGM93440.1 MAG: hypothetical protein A2333_01995 [Candidatus Wolfebacteria bacterium RIFOXYB2_FULL_49_7]